MPSFCWACRAVRRSRSSRVLGGPGGAPEDTGGIGAGGHGVEVLVELGGGDFLGFIDGEEQVGGGTNDIGTRFAGEELEAGLAEAGRDSPGRISSGRAEPTGRHRGTDGRGSMLMLGLGLEGGGDGDDAAADAGIAEEQPGKDMGLELVLAGLAREDDDEGEAAMVEDGILDGAGDLDLVGTQG